MDPQYLASFGKIENQHWWFRARREIVLDQIRQSADSEPQVLLDIGPGAGGNLAYFQAELPRCRCSGVDPDPLARELCRQRSLDVQAGSATSLDTADASVDVVAILDVLEHIEDDLLAMHEVERVLKPGAFAVVTVPAYMWMWGPHDVVNDHKRRYRRSRVEQLAREAGLVVERSTYFNSLLFPAAALDRIFERIRHKEETEERLPAALLNRLFYRIFSLERTLLNRVRFPVGVSIMVIARKPAEAAGVVAVDSYSAL